MTIRLREGYRGNAEEKRANESSTDKRIAVINSETVREYRKSRRESQSRFWSRFGVSQSRGSRFEMGVAMPPTVAILLKLYFDGVITDDDLRAPSRLRKDVQNSAGLRLCWGN